MREIKVSDEVYDALMEISKEINKQDHRCTAMPYFYQVVDKRIVSADGESEFDGFYFISNNDSELYVDVPNNNNYTLKNFLEDFKKAFPWEYEENRERLEELDEDLWISELEYILDDFRIWYYQYITEYKNSFFTEKACKEHIKLNHYHYKHGWSDYMSHAWRNPEMEVVQKFLCELSWQEIHK